MHLLVLKLFNLIQISLKCVTKGQLPIFKHCFRYWLDAEQAISHYLNQWWPCLRMHICITCCNGSNLCKQLVWWFICKLNRLIDCSNQTGYLIGVFVLLAYHWMKGYGWSLRLSVHFFFASRTWEQCGKYCVHQLHKIQFMSGRMLEYILLGSQRDTTVYYMAPHLL